VKLKHNFPSQVHSG